MKINDQLLVLFYNIPVYYRASIIGNSDFRQKTKTKGLSKLFTPINYE